MPEFNIQAYLKFVQNIEGNFQNFLIPVTRLRQGLKEAANMQASDDAPVIQMLKNFPEEIAKTRVPIYFEHCIHSQTAGEGWIQDVKRRQLLVKLIKHRLDEALGQIAISSSMVSSQPKLIEALHAFELVARFGHDLEKFTSWNNLVSSLMIEAENLSHAKSTLKTK